MNPLIDSDDSVLSPNSGSIDFENNSAVKSEEMGFADSDSGLNFADSSEDSIVAAGVDPQDDLSRHLTSAAGSRQEVASPPTATPEDTSSTPIANVPENVSDVEDSAAGATESSSLAADSVAVASPPQSTTEPSDILEPDVDTSGESPDALQAESTSVLAQSEIANLGDAQDWVRGDFVGCEVHTSNEPHSTAVSGSIQISSGDAELSSLDQTPIVCSGDSLGSLPESFQAAVSASNDGTDLADLVSRLSSPVSPEHSHTPELSIASSQQLADAAGSKQRLGDSSSTTELEIDESLLNPALPDSPERSHANVEPEAGNLSAQQIETNRETGIAKASQQASVGGMGMPIRTKFDSVEEKRRYLSTLSPADLELFKQQRKERKELEARRAARKKARKARRILEQRSAEDDLRIEKLSRDQERKAKGQEKRRKKRSRKKSGLKTGQVSEAKLPTRGKSAPSRQASAKKKLKQLKRHKRLRVASNDGHSKLAAKADEPHKAEDLLEGNLPSSSDSASDIGLQDEQSVDLFDFDAESQVEIQQEAELLSAELSKSTSQAEIGVQEQSDGLGVEEVLAMLDDGEDDPSRVLELAYQRRSDLDDDATDEAEAPPKKLKSPKRKFKTKEDFKESKRVKVDWGDPGFIGWTAAIIWLVILLGWIGWSVYTTLSEDRPAAIKVLDVPD